MKKSPEITELVLRWIKKADNDLINAEHTLRLEKDCPLDTVCYHAQQCAEKYIKALLTFEQVKFPKIHDLSELLSLLPYEKELEDELKGYEELMVYAVGVKYPGYLEDISREDAKRAVLLAERVKDTVRKRLAEVL